MQLPEKLRPEGVSTGHRWLNLPTQLLSTYNSWDIYTTARLRRVQERELERNGQLAFFRDWFQIVPVAIRMQRRGFGQIDQTKLDALECELEMELLTVQKEVMSKCSIFERLEAEAQQWHRENKEAHPTWGAKLEKGLASRLRKIEKQRETFWGKSKLLRQFVFDELGLKAAPKTRERAARSLSMEALMWMMERFRVKDEPHRGTLEALIHIAKLNTVLDRYMHPPTRGGRMYPTLRLYAAESLRWSYIRPALHQWTPRMRTVVYARKGHVFVSRDFSQIELGIMAFLAGDTAQVEAFLDPARDMHIETAMDSLAITRAEWDRMDKAHAKALRNVFKSTGYRRNYGGEGGKIAENTKVCPCHLCRKEEGLTGSARPLTAKEMKLADARWRAKHPRILAFRESLLEHVQTHANTWTSPFGYTRVWCGPLDAIKRSVYNFPQQHGVSEIIRRKMIELERRLAPLIRPGEDWGMVLQMHDEIIVECPLDRAAEVDALMKEVMEGPVEQIRWQGKPVCFPTDGKTAECWGDLK